MGRKDKNADDQQMEVSGFTGMMMTIFFAVLSLAFLFPIFLVFMNAFKSKLYISDAPFRFPVAEAYVGLGNYIEGVRKTGFFMAFGRSLFITVCSVAVIVLFTSMTAWYITRVKTKFYSVLYYVFVFAMIVPFQMVMFTMSKTANDLYLNSIYGLILLYLGFGAGQAVFLFCWFVKAIPLEIEEAAMVDGMTRVGIFFQIVVPMVVPGIFVAFLFSFAFSWNEFLYALTLTFNKAKTLPFQIAGMVSHSGPRYAEIAAQATYVMIPMLVIEIAANKYIVRGLSAGALKS